MAVFRGIPFAQPPVGALRFAAPRAVRAWDGVREAAMFGPPPPQSGFYSGIGWMLFGPEPPASAVALGDLMRAQWAAFAAHGGPAGPRTRRAVG